jgi:hypothetical protein
MCTEEFYYQHVVLLSFYCCFCKNVSYCELHLVLGDDRSASNYMTIHYWIITLYIAAVTRKSLSCSQQQKNIGAMFSVRSVPRSYKLEDLLATLVCADSLLGGTVRFILK